MHKIEILTGRKLCTRLQLHILTQVKILKQCSNSNQEKNCIMRNTKQPGSIVYNINQIRIIDIKKHFTEHRQDKICIIWKKIKTIIFPL